MLPLLIELMPHHETYAEVFSGGLTLFWNKQPSKIEIVNDIDRRIVDLLCVVKDFPSEFQRQVCLLPNSRELFNEFKIKIISEPDKIKRAAMFYYLILNGWSGKSLISTYVSKHRNTAKIDNFGWFANRLRHTTIENMDCVDLIKKYDSDKTFFFADPPYVKAGASLYQHAFKDKDHVRFANAFKSAKGKFLITYDNHPLIQLLYRNFPQFVYETPRTMARDKVNPIEQHLIIANYDIVNRDFKPFQAKYFNKF